MEKVSLVDFESYYEKIDSHTFVLDVLEVGNKLCETSEIMELRFVRGENKNLGYRKQKGVSIMQILECGVEHLKSVNVGELHSQDTDKAIEKLQECIMWLQKRAIDREKRGVLYTHNK